MYNNLLDNMNLIELKNHILEVCEGKPEPMQQKALALIEERMRDNSIFLWLKNNKMEASKFMEMSFTYGSISNVQEALNKKNSHSLYRNKLREVRDLKDKLKELQDEKV